MGLKQEIEQALMALVGNEWQVRNGLTVPKSENVVLRDGAVQLDAVYLYADMLSSTQLVKDFAPGTATKVMRAFINPACRVIRKNDGFIRSFDGDRVMGIFVGTNKETRAVLAALEMGDRQPRPPRPALASRLPSLARQGFELSHVSGVASGSVFIARAGIRDHNDLISVGQAANVAAKLSDIREAPQYRTYITKPVYDAMAVDRRIYNGQEMWEARSIKMGTESVSIYRSNWGTVLG